MGKVRKTLRIFPLATNRQENWHGLVQSWPKIQRCLAEIAASQQSFGISTGCAREGVSSCNYNIKYMKFCKTLLGGVSPCGVNRGKALARKRGEQLTSGFF